MANAKVNTVDPDEVEKFTSMAETWWDETGPFKPLHQFNPIRIAYIRNQIAAHFNADINTSPLNGLMLLDVGCGGGLIAEPMKRLGATVTAIDASEKNIAIASLHAKQEELDINYQCCSIETLAFKDKDPQYYDIVLALEIIEHVADVEHFIEACSRVVKPGGLLFIATLNRTLKSFALAKIGAEYILRWLPYGTHDWKKFLRPSEIVTIAESQHLKMKHLQGFSFNLLQNEWHLSDDIAVNYSLVLEKR